MSCRGLHAWQETVKNYVTQAHIVNSFHQLSLCSRRIWEFFFMCKFTMVCFFNDNYKVMTILILFMLVFKMFVVGVFCNCHNIWSSWRCITQVRNIICSLRMHDCISGLGLDCCTMLHKWQVFSSETLLVFTNTMRTWTKVMPLLLKLQKPHTKKSCWPYEVYIHTGQIFHTNVGTVTRVSWEI
jgi:hypothetical protein